tara:strand:+ start:2339 stop:3625 length:1287 start_codon:yes stop_codon:yes gene_type:complete
MKTISTVLLPTLLIQASIAFSQESTVEQKSEVAFSTNRCLEHKIGEPKLFIWNHENLSVTKNSLRISSSSELEKSHKALLKRADRALTEGPYSVVFKTSLPPSGSKHDYYSIAPYWWPNPNTKSGLPYIQKDGERNPESKSSASDRVPLSHLSNNVSTLALASYFSDDKRYAKKASELIRVWFLDKRTRMNPNLNYAQAIPGITTGRGIGIIDTYSFVQIVDSIGVLGYLGQLSTREVETLKQWFTEYTLWLITSEHGKEERRKSNNHGLYYDVQVAIFSAFADDFRALRAMIDSVKRYRIPGHINRKGQMPHELKRTRSFHYTSYTLRGFLDAADLGECVGEDLWNFKTKRGVGIKLAIDYQADFSGNLGNWRFKEIGSFDTKSFYSNLLRAQDAFGDIEYKKKALHYRQANSDSLSKLLYPKTLLE